MLASDLPEVEEGLPMPERVASWDTSVTELYDQQELLEILDAAMQSLPEKLRGAFFLRDIEEMSTEEAAQVLEITPGAVKVRLHRARLLMREQLTAVLGEAVQRN
jgi:RNA polymerase sigma-70 factor (ECF subfamily)